MRVVGPDPEPSPGFSSRPHSLCSAVNKQIRSRTILQRYGSQVKDVCKSNHTDCDDYLLQPKDN